MQMHTMIQQFLHFVTENGRIPWAFRFSLSLRKNNEKMNDEGRIAFLHTERVKACKY